MKVMTQGDGLSGDMFVFVFFMGVILVLVW